jgi:hypothetical protein
MNAQHLAKTACWGTPSDIVERARTVMGSIDLDPASEPLHNKVVKATRYYTAEDNGLTQPWEGNIFLNPPGDKSGKLVKDFWKKLIEEYVAGRVKQAIYVAFSIEQLGRLQGAAEYNPMHFPFCIPRHRVCFNDENGIEQSQPTHSNAIVYLHGFSGNVSKFTETFFSLGQVVWG